MTIGDFSRKSIILVGLLVPMLFWSFQLKDEVRGESLQSFYTIKAKRFLVKHDVIWDYVEINNRWIDIFASPDDKKNNIPECRLYWDEVGVFNTIVKKFRYEDAFATYKNKGTSRFDSLLIAQTSIIPTEKVIVNAKLPLAGKRIAIDPGHVGNDFQMGLIESRFVKMDLGDEKIEFSEAELTFATAYLLKDMLEAQGAEVILTRTSCNTSSLGISFSEWYKTRMDGDLIEAVNSGKISKEFADWLKNEASEAKVFQKFFQTLDWRERCKIINDFRPDLTLIIHYNADEENYTWSKPTTKNYNVAFVGGGYVKDELLKEEDRFQFLRQLVSTDIENSVKLSGSIVKCFENCLKVPTMTKKDESNSIKNFSLPTSQKGVYARNLALTRYILGPICYGESLLQDNIQECRALNKRDLDYPCGKTSSRVKDVATAYYKGIFEYLKINN
ncbi:MAG TPA: N-acetylmuramoyl-L-alanine amidase [Cytophagales bacterium]|nr:N-acetylmuramoyl-L-alanine amidase [Cytophagales bacterium]